MNNFWEDLAKMQDDFDHETFNKLGELLCTRHPTRFKNIYLDIFEKDGEEHFYIVVVFFGGGMSVRNANMNSLTANIRELSKMLDGSYYEEVKYYLSLKNKGESEESEE